MTTEFAGPITLSEEHRKLLRQTRGDRPCISCGASDKEIHISHEVSFIGDEAVAMFACESCGFIATHSLHAAGLIFYKGMILRTQTEEARVEAETR